MVAVLRAVALSLDFLLEANQFRLPISTPFNPAFRIDDQSLPKGLGFNIQHLMSRAYRVTFLLLFDFLVIGTIHLHELFSYQGSVEPS